MARTVLHFLKQHLRIGYVSGLLIVDCLAIILILIDVYRFIVKGLSLQAAYISTPAVISSQVSLDVILTMLSFIFIMPFLIAVIRIIVGTGTRWSGIIGVRKRSFTFIHIAFSALIACSLILIKSMQTVSGYKWSSDGLNYAFTPHLQPAIFFFAINIVTLLLLSLTFILGIIGNIIAAMMMEGPRRFYLLKEYTARCLLADLGGDLYPVNGRHKLNFNAAAIAPEIRAIRNRCRNLSQPYQNYIPGSKASGDYLQSISDKCRELLKELLFYRTSNARYEIEFFPGTSRALEVALSRLKGNSQIILSPFEHPVEANVVNWFTSISQCKFIQLAFYADDYDHDWEQQKNKFIDQLMALQRPKAETSTLVLSHVCYATGLVIPVWDTIAEIRERWKSPRLNIIVDGAHYVGNNNTLETVGDCDAYIFSAHKWLLAPEPLGIMISPRRHDLKPYDSWHKLLPSSTASAHGITGLMASLELLNNVGFEHLWLRSRELRERFLERIQSKFEVVGENTELTSTFILTLRPKQPLRWGDEQRLREYLRQHSVSLYIISIDPDCPWIRVAFPYFLEFRQLKSLCDLIEGALLKT